MPIADGNLTASDGIDCFVRLRRTRNDNHHLTSNRALWEHGFVDIVGDSLVRIPDGVKES